MVLVCTLHSVLTPDQTTDPHLREDFLMLAEKSFVSSPDDSENLLISDILSCFEAPHFKNGIKFHNLKVA